MAAVKLDKDGQIAIPLDIRRRHGWKEGRKFDLVERGDQLTLVPARDDTVKQPVDLHDHELSMREFLQRYAGVADGGLTTDEVMAMTRGDD